MILLKTYINTAIGDMFNQYDGRIILKTTSAVQTREPKCFQQQVGVSENLS